MMLNRSFTRSVIWQCYNISKRRKFQIPLNRICSTPPRRDVSVNASSNEEWILRSPFTDVVVPENVSISEHLFNVIERFSNRVAVADGETGHSLKYSEVRTLSLRLASSLNQLGFTKGDIVGLISPNCPEFIVSLMGLNVVGAVPAAISHTSSTEEIKFQLELAECVAVICHKDKLSAVREVCLHNKNIRHIITIGTEQEGFLSMEKLLKDNGRGIPSFATVNEHNDLAVIPFSSGTTGLPKAVMLTNRNLLANTEQTTHPDQCTCLKGESQHVLLGLVPMYHSSSLWFNIILSMTLGCNVITMNGLKLDVFFDIMKKYKPTTLPLVPPIIQFLVNSPLVTPQVLESVEIIFCGAAPLGHVLVEAFFAKFGKRIKFFEGYGLTEMSPITHMTPIHGGTIGSCGILVPNTSSKLIDPGTGFPIGPGVREGELCLKGPQMMKGYYKNEEATNDTIKDGWLLTGDIARIDENENVFIVDRLKELIKVKGLQVAPAELENLLRKHPEVADVAVIGVPDERAGERPRAFVVLKKQKTVTEEELKLFVAQKVSAHKQLEKVVFIDVIPKSPAGKILRKNLKHESKI